MPLQKGNGPIVLFIRGLLWNQNMISLTYKTHMLILHKSILRLHTTAQHSKAKHWPLTWIPPLRLRYLKKSKAKALHVRDCIIFQGKNLLRKENKKDGTGTWSNDPIWSSLALAKLSLVTKAPTLEGCRGVGVLKITQVWLRDDSQTWLRDASNMT